MENVIKFELSQEYLERLRTAIEGQEEDFIKSTLEGVNPADISSVLNEFEVEEARYVLNHLEKEVGAEVLTELDEDTQEDLFKSFSSEETAAYIDLIDSDDAADILNDLPVIKKEEVIALLDNEEKVNHIIDLLRYDENCAGGLMAKELIKANVNWTVGKCIEEIRRQAENVQKMYSVYVVDNKDKLLGRISLKKLIIANDKARISDIYNPGDLVKVETYMDEEEVAMVMEKYDLESVPVVNLQGKLVGRITIDDVVDVMREMAEQERQLMSGISEDVEEDDSIWVLSRARLPWLVIGMTGSLLGASFMGLFEGDIAQIPAMAFFVPLIMATGGNVGIQSTSIVLQSFANRSAFGDKYAKRFYKGFLVSLLNGLVLSSLVLAINLLLGEDMTLSMVVSFALLCVVLLASFTGTLIPIVLDKMGLNPAVASGPFITTANDLVGLCVYFGAAHLLYGL